GLPVLVAPDERSTSAICEQWLGVQPPPRAIQGTTVRVSWVKGVFDRLPDKAPEEVVTYHARAFTWVLLGGVLLADRSGDHISVHILPLLGDPLVAGTYSWVSAVLAWLYKVMGRAAFFIGGSLRGTGDIGGFTLLVELWALERFPRIVERYIEGGDLPVDDSIPRGMRWLPIIERHQHRVAMCLEDIRYALDRCTDFVIALHGTTQIVVSDSLVSSSESPRTQSQQDMWMAADFRSSVSDWRTKYRQFVSHWGERDQHIATSDLASDDSRHHFHDEYDEWYRRRTRLAISNDALRPVGSQPAEGDLAGDGDHSASGDHSAVGTIQQSTPPSLCERSDAGDTRNASTAYRRYSGTSKARVSTQQQHTQQTAAHSITGLSLSTQQQQQHTVALSTAFNTQQQHTLCRSALSTFSSTQHHIIIRVREHV
ncbi:Serine/threonine-protein phosphatase 7 long form homolog, partial [Linum perenne]